MMDYQWITGSLPDKKYAFCEHSSGLKIYLYPMPDFSSNYALFGTKYGSIDNEYTANGERVLLPEGIAHFLEHKLFESEDGDAFTKYAKTGAYANAYTSFDRTCYLFSCSNRFYDNLGILLDFVRSPYFTAQTVQKEQGIIGQEIRMYRDMPNWRVMINMLEGMFHNHPVKIDIPGTEQSIAQITDKLLYGCYDKFYDLSNMFLVLSGNFEVEKVLEFIGTNLKTGPRKAVQKSLPQEPQTVVKNYTEQAMQVVKPLFCIGFKEKMNSELVSIKHAVQMELLLHILIGPASPLYKRLLDERLINEEFGSEYFTGRGFALPLLEGESEQPKKVLQLLLKEVERLKQQGIDQTLYEAVLRETYGKSMMRFDSAENIATMLCDSAVQEYNLFDYFEALKNTTKQDLQNLLSVFDEKQAVLSVITNQKG